MSFDLFEFREYLGGYVKKKFKNEFWIGDKYLEVISM